MINFIAIRTDCTAITGEREDAIAVAKSIISEIDDWDSNIVKVYIGSTDAAYSIEEIREIAES